MAQTAFWALELRRNSRQPVKRLWVYPFFSKSGNRPIAWRPPVTGVQLKQPNCFRRKFRGLERVDSIKQTNLAVLREQPAWKEVLASKLDDPMRFSAWQPLGRRLDGVQLYVSICCKLQPGSIRNGNRKKRMQSLCALFKVPNWERLFQSLQRLETGLLRLNTKANKFSS